MGRRLRQTVQRTPLCGKLATIIGDHDLVRLTVPDGKSWPGARVVRGRDASNPLDPFIGIALRGSMGHAGKGLYRRVR